MARRGRSLLNALKSVSRGSVRDKKLKSARAQYWGTEGTKDYRKARKGWGVGQDKLGRNREYNTRMFVMQGDSEKERKDPRLRRARRCMERAMLSGQSGKNAFNSCGMSYGSTAKDESGSYINEGDYRRRGSRSRHGIVFGEE